MILAALDDERPVAALALVRELSRDGRTRIFGGQAARKGDLRGFGVRL